MKNSSRLRVFGKGAVCSVAITLLTAAAFGWGFANYDTLYALVWGSEVGHGKLPTYDVPLAPTPHPLSNLLGLLLTPFGTGAETVAIVMVGFLSLGALGYLTYCTGKELFGPVAGVVAAVLLLTREPVLSFAVRAYIDIPYVALVLGALLIELRRPRAGTPVLVVLGVAGLLRPEAWLFAFAYVGYLLWSDSRYRTLPATVKFGALAAAGPVIWLLSDLALAGDPLYSLTLTQDSAETLGRVTGITNVPVTVPRRIGEILREPVLLAAAGGGLMAVFWLRGRQRAQAHRLALAGVLAVLTFTLLAASGLPIITRYLLLPAVVLVLFAGAGLAGWLRLGAGDRHRRPWVVFACLSALVLGLFIPQQVRKLDRLSGQIKLQTQIRDDLKQLVDRGTLNGRCGPIAVPNHRPVPLIALLLDIEPNRVVSAQENSVTRGYFLAPASRRVERNFILDRSDLKRLAAPVPPGFKSVADNRSWKVYKRC